MKSTKWIRVATLCAALSLSGCASFDSVFSGSPPPDQQQINLPASDDFSDDKAIETDPLQQKVAALRARPNLYLSGQLPVASGSQSLFTQALQANEDGHPDIAAKLFITLTQTQPKLSGPWLQLGNLTMQKFAALDSQQFEQRQKLLNEAKAHYQKAIDVNRHNYFAQNRLARVLRELGEFEQAEQHYHHAIASWPAYDNSYLNLGILHDLYLGNKQQALEYYQLYQALQPEPVRKVRGWIADLTRQLAQNSTAGAAQ